MAATKVFIRDKEYGATTAGVATAYTLAIAGFGSYEDLKSFNVKFHVTNGVNATLNINSLGAKTLVDQNNTALPSSLLDTDGVYIFAYNLSNDSFVFMNSVPSGSGISGSGRVADYLPYQISGAPNDGYTDDINYMTFRQGATLGLGRAKNKSYYYQFGNIQTNTTAIVAGNYRNSMYDNGYLYAISDTEMKSVDRTIDISVNVNRNLVTFVGYVLGANDFLAGIDVNGKGYIWSFGTNLHRFTVTPLTRTFEATLILPLTPNFCSVNDNGIYLCENVFPVYVYRYDLTVSELERVEVNNAGGGITLKKGLYRYTNVIVGLGPYDRLY